MNINAYDKMDNKYVFGSLSFENLDFKDEIYLGIRPEDISLTSNNEIQVDVKVDLVENLGFEKIIHTKPYAGLTKQSNKIDDCGWVANRWAELLPITAQDRQKLLEELEPIERLKKIIRLLSEYGVS